MLFTKPYKDHALRMKHHVSPEEALLIKHKRMISVAVAVQLIG